MAIQTEKKHAGEFIVSKGNGSISRDGITVASGQNLEVGTVMGKVTASGKYIAYADGAADGSQVARGILYDAVDASAGDEKGVLFSRLGEVEGAALTGNDANGTADLLSVNIIVR